MHSPTVTHPNQTDTDPQVKAFSNCVLDLATGEPLSRDDAAQKFITGNTGIPWDADARHPAVDKIFPLPEFFPKDSIEYQRAMDLMLLYGWLFSHYPNDGLVVESGETATGKTMRNLLLRLAGGSYISTLRPDALRAKMDGGETINSEMRALGPPHIICFWVRWAAHAWVSTS